MSNVRWLGLAVIAAIAAVLGLNLLSAPWNGALAGLALLLGCAALVQEIRRARP